MKYEYTDVWSRLERLFLRCARFVRSRRPLLLALALLAWQAQTQAAPATYYKVWCESPQVAVNQHKFVQILATAVERNQESYAPVPAGTRIVNPRFIQWDDPDNPGKKIHAAFPWVQLYDGVNYTARVIAVNQYGESAQSAPSMTFDIITGYQPPAPGAPHPEAPPTPTGVELFP